MSGAHHDVVSARAADPPDAGGRRAFVLRLAGALVLLALAACSDGPTGPEARVSIRRVGEGHFADISGDRVVWMLRFVVAPGFSPSRIALGDFDGGDTTIISGPDVVDEFPDVSDRYVVWERHEKDDPDILAYDIETGEIVPVATGPAVDQRPAVDAGRVVFTRRTGAGDPDAKVTREIILVDLSTGETRKLNPNEGALQGNADISGDIVVWADNSDGTSDIVYRDLSTGEFVNVTRDRGNASFPAISGSLIAWRDVRNVEPGQQGLDENTDIFAFDIETGEEFQITTGPGFQNMPVVSGNRVAWSDWSGARTQVFVAEIER